MEAPLFECVQLVDPLDVTNANSILLNVLYTVSVVLLVTRYGHFMPPQRRRGSHLRWASFRLPLEYCVAVFHLPSLQDGEQLAHPLTIAWGQPSFGISRVWNWGYCSRVCVRCLSGCYVFDSMPFRTAFRGFCRSMSLPHARAMILRVSWVQVAEQPAWAAALRFPPVATQLLYLHLDPVTLWDGIAT